MFSLQRENRGNGISRRHFVIAKELSNCVDALQTTHHQYFIAFAYVSQVLSYNKTVRKRNNLNQIIRFYAVNEKRQIAVNKSVKYFACWPNARTFRM